MSGIQYTSWGPRGLPICSIKHAEDIKSCLCGISYRSDMEIYPDTIKEIITGYVGIIRLLKKISDFDVHPKDEAVIKILDIALQERPNE